MYFFKIGGNLWQVLVKQPSRLCQIPGCPLQGTIVVDNLAVHGGQRGIGGKQAPLILDSKLDVLKVVCEIYIYYPPVNNITHIGNRKTIDSKVLAGMGYVGSQDGSIFWLRSYGKTFCPTVFQTNLSSAEVGCLIFSHFGWGSSTPIFGTCQVECPSLQRQLQLLVPYGEIFGEKKEVTLEISDTVDTQYVFLIFFQLFWVSMPKFHSNRIGYFFC